KVRDGANAKAKGDTHKRMLERDLPMPKPAAVGMVRVVDYPYSDTANPGPMMLAWPARRDLDEAERVLRQLFLDALAGDESTVLYKKLSDGKTREDDLGGKACVAFWKTHLSRPSFGTLRSVKPDILHLTSDEE